MVLRSSTSSSRVASARIAARLTGWGLDRFPLRLDSDVHPFPVKRRETLNGAGAPVDGRRRAAVFFAGDGGASGGVAGSGVAGCGSTDATGRGGAAGAGGGGGGG